VPLRAFEIGDHVVDGVRDGLNQAIESWNSSAAPVRFDSNRSNGNRVIVEHMDRNVWGSFSSSTGSGSISSFTIRICYVRISAFADPDDLDICALIAGTMAHELGHAIGLRDGEQPDNRHPTILGGFSNASLMNSDRNRLVINFPQQFDIDSVELIYDE